MKHASLYYDLCLFSYFDIPHFEKGMSVETWINQVCHDEQIEELYHQEGFFIKYLEALKEITVNRYRHFHVMCYVNDNTNSGVVAYVIQKDDMHYVVFRGSEALDQLQGRSGWQDWQDNFHMFLKTPTEQQLFAWNFVESLDIKGAMTLCGHSKGGNLAGFAYICASEKQDDKIVSVVSLNAPGFCDSILEPYRERIVSKRFQERLLWIESEHDCISAMFEPLTTPVIVKSKYALRNFTSLFDCHNIYGYALDEGRFIETKRKHKLCDLCSYVVNQVFMNQKKELIQLVVEKADTYFESNLSIEELYHMFVYHIGHYTKVMDELCYEEIRQLEFSTLRKLMLEEYVISKVKGLPEHRKAASLFVKNMVEGVLTPSQIWFESKETIKKAVSDKWNEISNTDRKGLSSDEQIGNSEINN